MALLVGQTVGRFRVDAVVGRGGMGEVFRGHDVELARTVAIKGIREDIGMTEAEHLERVGRFAREARLAARFLHPNFCALYDVVEQDGRAFLVMEWIDGTTLKKAMQDPTVALDRRLEWIAVLARALGDAHDANIVHRDFKPSNVMVAHDGTLKILDFGLATHAVTETAVVGDFRTLTGSVLGTDRYMAPEQMAGARVDARADQFAWAVVAYELLGRVHPANAGEPTFPAAPPTALDVIEPRVPTAVSRAVMRALLPLPSERFASMTALVLALEERPSPVAPAARRGFCSRPLFVASGLAGFAIAAVAVSAMLAIRRVPPPSEPTSIPVASVQAELAPDLDAALDAEAPTDEPPRLPVLADAGPRPRPRPFASVWRVSTDDAGGVLVDRRLPPEPPPPGPGPRVVRARESESYASGYLPEELMAVARSLVPTLTPCFNVPNHPSADQDLSIAIVVEEDGRVTGVNVVSAIDATAKPCVRSAVLSARFPFHPRSRPASIRLDFALLPVTPP